MILSRRLQNCIVNFMIRKKYEKAMKQVERLENKEENVISVKLLKPLCSLKKGKNDKS